MERNTKKVDIILLNFNNLKFTKICINSLFSNTNYPFNLIIVDNASTEKGTKEYFEMLKRQHKNVIVHYNKKPDSGFSEGNNTALRYSQNDYILLLNNDIYIPKKNKNWLKDLLDTFSLNEKIAIVGCKLLYPNDTIQHAGCYLAVNGLFFHRGRFWSKEHFSTLEELPMVTFACILAKRKIFGYLDETYKMGTFEDCDKCTELRSKGYKVYYNGKVELYHYETATQFKRPKVIWEKQQKINESIFKKRWWKWIVRDLRKNPSLYGWSRKLLKTAIERGWI